VGAGDRMVEVIAATHGAGCGCGRGWPGGAGGNGEVEPARYLLDLTNRRGPTGFSGFCMSELSEPENRAAITRFVMDRMSDRRDASWVRRGPNNQLNGYGSLVSGGALRLGSDWAAAAQSIRVWPLGVPRRWSLSRHFSAPDLTGRCGERRRARSDASCCPPTSLGRRSSGSCRHRPMGA
jgi:hypothetical protein